MADQWVLRGASCATPRSHARLTYRNFFPSDARWQFTGVRLFAKDMTGTVVASRQQVDVQWRAGTLVIDEPTFNGDAIGGRMLAHKSEEEGVAAVEFIAGNRGHVTYDAVANIVYTWPEIASVGASEEELKEKGIAYTVGKFPWLANGRARAMGEADGFVPSGRTRNTPGSENSGGSSMLIDDSPRDAAGVQPIPDDEQRRSDPRAKVFEGAYHVGPVHAPGHVPRVEPAVRRHGDHARDLPAPTHAADNGRVSPEAARRLYAGPKGARG